ncbi:MAG: HEAT repeat domain-containing protein [Pirellulales bacterium]|nr:HEAT repeat domain-containing protein [Pirellulales bacterium]
MRWFWTKRRQVAGERIEPDDRRRDKGGARQLKRVPEGPGVHGRNPAVQGTADPGTGGGGDERAVRALLRDLRNGDARMAQALIPQLVSLGEAAVAPLIDALSDSDRPYRNRAVEALGKIGPPAVPALLAVVESGPKAAKLGAARALGAIGDRRAVGPLIRMLDSGREELGVASEALSLIGDPSAVEAIVKNLGEFGMETLMQGCAASFGTKAVGALVTALASPSATVRERAANALGVIRDAQAVQPLTHAVADARPEVRLAATLALGELGEPAVDALVAALVSEDCRVRETAAAILGRIGDPRAIGSLQAATADAEPRVRDAASAALSRLQT